MHFFFTSTAIPVVTELGRYLGGRQSEQETIEQKTLRFGKTANLPIHHLIFGSEKHQLIPIAFLSSLTRYIDLHATV